MKKLISLLILMIILGQVNAQQDPMFTHYMMNTLGVNPAYAGSRQALTFTGLHRSQWVGFEGAPETQTFTLHSPVFSDKVGLGLSVVNDAIGPMKTSSFYADFAYHLKINDKSKLSFGIKGGGSIFNNGLSELTTVQQSDISFAQNIQSKFLPNVGFGMYYYRPKFYAGVSVPRLIENKFMNDQSVTNVNLFWEKRHYFFIMGSMIDINENLQFKPTTLVKVNLGSPVQADFTAQFIYNSKFSLGAMYKTGSAFGGLLGFSPNEQLYLGYSFDWSTLNRTGRYNSGTHEVILRYDFIFRDKQKIKSPRYF